MNTRTRPPATNAIPTQRRGAGATRRTQKRVGLQRCGASGKRRFRDHREAITALQRAANQRLRAELEGFLTQRHEVRTYECNACQGWHLTSQPQWAAA